MTDVEQFVQDAIEQVGDQRVFIGAMARILKRYEHTVRRWVKESEAIYEIVGEVPEGKGFLPQDLWPEREPEGRRRIFWWSDQIEGMQEFAALKELRQGWHGSRRG